MTEKLWNFPDPREERDCHLYKITGAHLADGESCAHFPCVHTPCHDLDWLADRQLRREDPFLHQLSWACFAHPDNLAECSERMEPEALKLLREGVDRCRRVNGKLDEIQRDYDQCDKNYRAEWETNNEYWESFTEAEIEEFCKDLEFELEYERYLDTIDETQDDDEEEVPKAEAVPIKKEDRGRHLFLFSDEPDSDTELGF
jgi:hypothetical protein